MMTQATPSVHASAVLVGAFAVLIRGPSGAGKSRLAFDLILAARAGQIAASTLVGDDRVMLEARENALLVRPAPELAGLIEIRGLGLRQITHAAEAQVGLVVDLAADDAARLPQPESQEIVISGVTLPRIAVPTGYTALPLVVASLITRDALGPAASRRLPEGIL